MNGARQRIGASAHAVYAATGIWVAWNLSAFLSPASTAALACATLICSLALSILVGWEKRWRIPRKNVFGALFAACAPAGTLLSYLGAASLNPLPLVLGAILAGMGCAGAFLAIGGALGGQDVGRNMHSVPIAAGLGALLYLALSQLPPLARSFSFVALPLLAGTLLTASAHIRISPSNASARGLAPGGTGPKAATPQNSGRTVANTPFDRWEITVKIAGFWLAFGFIWGLGLNGQLAQNDWSLHVICAGLACVMAGVMYVSFNKAGKNFMAAFWSLSAIMVIGVAAVAVMGGQASKPFFALALVERLFIQLVLFIHFAGLSHKSGYPTTLLFGRSFEALCAAEASGLLLGKLCAPLVAHWLALVLLGVLCIVIMSYIALIMQVNNGLHRTELERAVEVARQEALAQAQTASKEAEIPDRDALNLGDVFRLSAREIEVCSLLLDSRSASYIADKLGVSLSTANTHIRHIYAKVGVSSRQQLGATAESLRERREP